MKTTKVQFVKMVPNQEFIEFEVQDTPEINLKNIKLSQIKKLFGVDKKFQL